MNFNRFDELYEIMQQSFPEFELRTKEDQQKLLANPSYFLKTLNRGEEILAFLVYWELESCRFIEHVAARPALRGSGVGSALIKKALETSQKPVIIEVDPPVDDISCRRVEFYKRLGFHLNDFQYLLPPQKKGGKAEVLRIMSYPEPMSENKFIPYKKEIYLEAYGIR